MEDKMQAPFPHQSCFFFAKYFSSLAKANILYVLRGKFLNFPALILNGSIFEIVHN